MNRRKKATKLFDKRLKKARAKLAPKNQPNNKSKYISKANRLELEDETTQDNLAVDSQ